MTRVSALNIERFEIFTPARGKARGAAHWHGTVKVQRGLDSPGIVLIYNESRTIMHQQAMPPELRAMFLPDEWKIYADATYDRGVLKINARDNRRYYW